MKAPSTFGRRFLKSGWCRCHSFLKLRFGMLVTTIGIAVLVCGQAEVINYSTNIFVETIAGSGFSGYLDGTNTQTFLNEPWVVVVDQKTNVVFWEHGNNRVREVNPVGIVRTLAGSGMSGLVDGEGTNASFINITGMALLPDSSILLADNATIRRLDRNGMVSTFAGFQRGGFQDGDITNARFGGELYLAANAAGEVHVADTSNRRIRKISTNGVVSTVAGSGNPGVVDGTGIFSSFFCDKHRVRKITPDLTAVTLAGVSAGYADGEGSGAMFQDPLGLAVGPDGMIYVADRLNHRIRRVRYGQIPTANILEISMFAGITFSGEIGKNYRIEVRETLNQDTWRPVTTVLLSSNLYLWFDPDSTRLRNRFYRAVLLP